MGRTAPKNVYLYFKDVEGGTGIDSDFVDVDNVGLGVGANRFHQEYYRVAVIISACLSPDPGSDGTNRSRRTLNEAIFAAG